MEQSTNDRGLVRVINHRPASGGADRETLEAAQARVRRERKARFRAVTSADYEELARSTPGLRVARAEAIPLYAPGPQIYPLVEAPATVTIVVVPYSLAPRPTPSRGFRQTVCRHLEKHRLITTQIYVIGPEYAEITVEASVVLQAGVDSPMARARIEEALDGFLDPLDGGPDGRGWPFGRPAYRSEIYQTIEKVQGVDCVNKVRLTARGGGSSRDSEGNITIPETTLVYSGNHQLEITSTDQVRRAKGASS